MSTAEISSPPSTKRTSLLAGWMTSSIGKKTIVAVTGIILVGYVIAHLLGNLSIFIGQDAINSYAVALHTYPALLWVARIILLIAFFAHIYFTILLTVENRMARPQKYAVKTNLKATLFARAMAWTGIVVFVFVLFHLAQFTLLATNPEFRDLHDALGRHDVYSMVITGFQNVWVTLFYLLAIGLLTFHLSHGIGSLFQTLGITNKRLQPVFAKGGLIFSWLLFLGYASIPLAVQLNILQLPVTTEVIHVFIR